MKVLCLFVRFGKEKYRPALDRLLAWQKQNLPLAATETWIIDNALPADAVPTKEDSFLLLPGDNTLREFSAWDSVLSKQAHRVAGFDVIHFVTEMFDTLYTQYLDHFHPDLLDYVSQHSTCLGHIDCYDREISIGDQHSQHWIRTCFYFMSPASVGKIGHIVSIGDDSLLFDEAGEFRPGTISHQYIRYITDWLGGVPIQGVSWHSRISDPVLFRKKVLAIVNEHMFSIQLRRQGIHLLDYCWAWYHRKQGKMPGHPTPGWRDQIEFRRDFLAGKIGSDMHPKAEDFEGQP